MKKLQTGRKCEIPYKLKSKVILYFKNNKENLSIKIARHYNISVKKVDRILDSYLNKIQSKI